MSDIYQIKRQARRDVHAAFSLAATYSDDTVAKPVSLAVRWHDDRAVGFEGDVGGPEYSRIFTNLDKIIFDADELAVNSLVPKRGGVLTLTDYGVSFTLDAREPFDGPLKVLWTVVKL